MRDGGTSKLIQDRPDPEGFPRTAEIIQFRPRERTGRGYAGEAAHDLVGSPEDEPVDHLAPYEQDREEDENVNYPHRMLMNVIAVAVVTMLIGTGVWLADTIADMERDQDCVLQGRQNCAPIELAAPYTSR